jgi:hypothetical protein
MCIALASQPDPTRPDLPAARRDRQDARITARKPARCSKPYFASSRRDKLGADGGAILGAFRAFCHEVRAVLKETA